MATISITSLGLGNADLTAIGKLSETGLSQIEVADAVVEGDKLKKGNKIVAYDGHLTSTSNPHSTTANQVGAYSKIEVDNLLTNTETLLSNKVDKVAGKGLSTNDFTDTFKQALELKKVQDISTDSVTKKLIVTYTDDTVANLNINDIVTDVKVEGAILDATTSTLTIVSSEGGADVVVDLSDFVNSGELTSALSGKADTIHSHSTSDITGLDTAISYLISDLNNKQDNLVSGTNIKTINGQSVLGSGDIVITGGGSGGEVDLTNYYTKSETYNKVETNSLVDTKQDTLVSGTSIKTINGNSVIGTGNILLRNSDYVETKRRGKDSLYLNGVVNETNASIQLSNSKIPQKDDEIIFSDGNVEKSIILKDDVNEDEDGYYTDTQLDAEVQDIFGDGSCTHVFGFNNTLKSRDEQFEFKKLDGTSIVGEYVEGLNNMALQPSNLGALEVKGLRPSLENLSISLWVKPIKIPTINTTILTVAGFDVIFDTAGKFGIVYGGTAKRCSKTINLNEWYLITITSPTTNLSNIKIYINKELQTPSYSINWETSARDLSLSLLSGYGASINDYSHIDTLRIFNRVLTIEDIDNLYSTRSVAVTEVRHNMGVVPTTANKMNIVKNINLLTYPTDNSAKADGLMSGDMYVDADGFIRMVVE